MEESRDDEKQDQQAQETTQEAPVGTGILDVIQAKLISRKLLVFVTATALLASAGLDSDTWGMIAIVYVGGQAAIDAVIAWRHGG